VEDEEEDVEEEEVSYEQEHLKVELEVEVRFVCKLLLDVGPLDLESV